jgi:hypothetical protein
VSNNCKLCKIPVFQPLLEEIPVLFEKHGWLYELGTGKTLWNTLSLNPLVANLGLARYASL